MNQRKVSGTTGSATHGHCAAHRGCTDRKELRSGAQLLGAFCLLGLALGGFGEEPAEGPYLQDLRNLCQRLGTVASVLVEWSDEHRMASVTSITSYRFVCDQKRYRLERVLSSVVLASAKKTVLAKECFTFDGSKALMLDSAQKTIMVRSHDGDWGGEAVLNPLFIGTAPLEFFGGLPSDPDPDGQPKTRGIRTLADFHDQGFQRKITLLAKALKPWPEHPGWLTQETLATTAAGSQVTRHLYFADLAVEQLGTTAIRTTTAIGEPGKQPKFTSEGRATITIDALRLPDGTKLPYAKKVKWDYTYLPAQKDLPISSETTVTKLKINAPVDDEDFSIDIAQAEHVYDADKKVFTH